MKKYTPIKLLILALLPLFVLSACKEDRIRSKFSGAWDVSSITITNYIDGAPASDTAYADCGVWSFVDNGLSGGTYNRSYISLSEDVPCVFRSSLTETNGRLSGLINWGADPYSEKRIIITIGGSNVILNVEKINRKKFVFFYFTQDGQNADDIKQMQRFELKRTNQ